jgi:hypothetical protein
MPFRYIGEDFFLACTFCNIDDLKEQLRRWLDTVASPRIHAITRRVLNETLSQWPRTERIGQKPSESIQSTKEAAAFFG